jgi:hypothetical protein
MSEVRRHQRKTASGKVTNVRRHTRDVDGAGRRDPGERERDGSADAAVPHVSSLASADPGPVNEDWWDDGAEDFASPPPDPKKDKRAAADRYKAAREALGNYYCDEEDDEYHRLNDAVIAAEKDVPWWRRTYL